MYMLGIVVGVGWGLEMYESLFFFWVFISIKFINDRIKVGLFF